MTKSLQVFILIMGLLGAQVLMAQGGGYEVRGVVRDSLTQETLPFANVFFSGTTYGTVSSRVGEFSLKPRRAGTYELVVSFTGYVPFRRQINLNQEGIVEIDINLAPEARYLGGVTVVAKKDRDWKRHMGVFQRVFLGYSRNAVSCRIVNEDILNFEFDEETGVLEAYAGEPLIIENRALGYRLTYVLESFHIYYNEGYSAFHGYPSFEELNKEGGVKKKWLKARERAYRGSVLHFMQALYQGKARQEGFNVSQGAMVNGVINISKDKEFDINGLVTTAADGVRKELRFQNLLFIEYLKELSEPGFQRSLSENASPRIRNSVNQISWLQMQPGVEKAIFEETGTWVNVRDFVLEGYWSYEKIADLIPSDYQPKQ